MILQMNIIIILYVTNIYDDKNTIILLYEEEIHFKLVGYFSGNKMITKFNKFFYTILTMVKIR